MRRVCLLVFWMLLAAAAPALQATDIVVLTDEPVAEFRLPDGTVLKNAFAWRRNSEGIMIIHDGGQLFMNFKTLPPDWQAAYLGTDPADQQKNPSKEAGPSADRYRVGRVLENVPALAPATRSKLVERGVGRDLDQGVLVIALLQAVLDDNREDAGRCMLYLEEKGYDIGEIERDRLFDPCPICGADGSVTRKCPDCSGSGECSACKETASGLGKRSSRDSESSTGLGKRSDQRDKRADCKACEGSGTCAKCGGDGKIDVRCGQCSGSGKLVARVYCEVVRDKWVREMNALVSGSPPASVMASPSLDMAGQLAQLPGIHADAPAFYASAGYAGQMDTNIVVACLMNTLVQRNLKDAKRFKVMLDVEYPDNDVIDIGNYLQFCQQCKGQGWSPQSCQICDGSGKCPKCKGDGDSMDLNNWSVACSACNGTGECSACGGTGEINRICRSCMGLGRVFETSRCEIRCELLVDELNEYYRRSQAK